MEVRMFKYGAEQYTTNELSIFKEKLSEANKYYASQFDDDLSSLNGIKIESMMDKIKDVSEKWGLKYEIHKI